MPAADQQECHQRKQLWCICDVSPHTNVPRATFVILHDWILETFKMHRWSSNWICACNHAFTFVQLHQKKAVLSLKSQVYKCYLNALRYQYSDNTAFQMNSWISISGLAACGYFKNATHFCPEYKTHKAQIHSKQNKRRRKKIICWKFFSQVNKALICIFKATADSCRCSFGVWSK